jgi:hypothetical protein
MKMRLQAVLLMCVLVIGLAATDATASGRKGFMLGVGLGAGFTWHKTELDPMTSDFLDLEHGAWHEFGIADALRIGYAPTNQIQIYLGGTAMFMDVEGESSQMVSGLSGLGVTYFFDEEAPSLFSVAGVGYSFWLDRTEGVSRDDLSSRPGWLLGLGYELAPHIAVESDVLWISPDDKDVRGLDDEGSHAVSMGRDVTSARLMLTYTFY